VDKINIFAENIFNNSDDIIAIGVRVRRKTRGLVDEKEILIFINQRFLIDQRRLPLRMTIATLK